MMKKSFDFRREHLQPT